MKKINPFVGLSWNISFVPILNLRMCILPACAILYSRARFEPAHSCLTSRPQGGLVPRPPCTHALVCSSLQRGGSRADRGTGPCGEPEAGALPCPAALPGKTPVKCRVAARGHTPVPVSPSQCPCLPVRRPLFRPCLCSHRLDPPPFPSPALLLGAEGRWEQEFLSQPGRQQHILLSQAARPGRSCCVLQGVPLSAPLPGLAPPPTQNVLRIISCWTQWVAGAWMGPLVPPGLKQTPLLRVQGEN